MELQTKNNAYKFNNQLTAKSIPFTSSKLLMGISAKGLSQLDQDTVTFTQCYKKGINNIALKNLDIRNLRLLDTRAVSGGTFEKRPIADLIELKNAGIETIIDFRSEANGIMAKKCRKTGLKYLNVPLDEVRERSNTRYFIMKDKLY